MKIKDLIQSLQGIEAIAPDAEVNIPGSPCLDVDTNTVRLDADFAEDEPTQMYADEDLFPPGA